MALITCPECGKQISDLAEACPGCGCPAKVWREKEPSPFADLQAGDVFALGSWAGEALNWRVLSIEDGVAYALCETGVECQPFVVSEWSSNDWAGSHLKKWLASTFLAGAFSADESQCIREVTCLADDEAKNYFADNAARVCLPSKRATGQGAYLSEITGGCCWWLRTPCDEETDAMYVDFRGTLHPYGCTIHDTGIAVRPALRLAIG